MTARRMTVMWQGTAVPSLDVAELQSGTEGAFVSDGEGHWTDETGKPLTAFDSLVRDYPGYWRRVWPEP